MKTINQILSEIVIEQERERSYKGTINRELYFYAYDFSDRQIQATYWKGRNVLIFDTFIGSAQNNISVAKVTVSNRFKDWEVVIFTK
jgi:hypothetical protein